MHLCFSLSASGAIIWNIWNDSSNKNGEIIAGVETMAPKKPDYEKESGYSTKADLGFLVRILGYLRRLIPKLGNVNVLRHWGGFADVTPDDLSKMFISHEDDSCHYRS